MEKKEEVFLDIISKINELQDLEEKNNNENLNVHHLNDLLFKYDFLINTAEEYLLDLLNYQIDGISKKTYFYFMSKRLKGLTKSINKMVKIDKGNIFIKELNFVIYRDLELNFNGPEKETNSFKSNYKCVSASILFSVDNSYRMINASKGIFRKSMAANSQKYRVYLNIETLLKIPLSDYISVRNLNKKDNLFIKLVEKTIEEENICFNENEKLFKEIVKSFSNKKFKEYVLNELMFIPDSLWLSNKLIDKNVDLTSMKYEDALNDKAFNILFNKIKENSKKKTVSRV